MKLFTDQLKVSALSAGYTTTLMFVSSGMVKIPKSVQKSDFKPKG